MCAVSRSFGLEIEPIAARDGGDQVVAVARERLAQLRDVDVDGLLGGRRRRFAPELVDQALRETNLVRMQEQRREHDPLLQRPERNRLALVEHLQRPEDAELHRCRFYRINSRIGSPRRRSPAPVLSLVLTGSLPAAVHPGGDGSPTASPPAETVAYHGEVWTDGRGFATVRLPDRGRAALATARVRAPRPRAAEQRPDNGRARERALHDRDRRAAREGRLADHRPAGGPATAPTTGGGMT